MRENRFLSCLIASAVDFWATSHHSFFEGISDRVFFVALCLKRIAIYRLVEP
jgi:hypothetical protein